MQLGNTRKSRIRPAGAYESNCEPEGVGRRPGPLAHACMCGRQGNTMNALGTYHLLFIDFTNITGLADDWLYPNLSIRRKFHNKEMALSGQPLPLPTLVMPSCDPLETESGCTRTKSRAGNVTNLLDFQDSHQNPPFCTDFAPELVPIPVQIRQST